MKKGPITRSGAKSKADVETTVLKNEKEEHDDDDEGEEEDRNYKFTFLSNDEHDIMPDGQSLSLSSSGPTLGSEWNDLTAGLIVRIIFSGYFQTHLKQILRLLLISKRIFILGTRYIKVVF